MIGRLVRTSALNRAIGQEPFQPTASSSQIGTESDIQVVPAAEAAQPSYFGYLSGVVTSLWGNQKQVNAEKEKKSQPKVIVKKFSRTEVSDRTRGLVEKLLLADSTSSKLLRTEELCKHLMDFPPSRVVAVQDSRLIVNLLKNIEFSKDEGLKADSRQCLALCGYVGPPKGQGVRILTIDGGGTRGMMGLEVLEALEECTGGQRICDLFDHIVGVSTGAIIAALIAAKKLPIKQCKEIYMEISRQLFNQGKILGVSGLLMSHSYYNTKKWVEILKKIIGDKVVLIDSSREHNTPKLSIVSCIVNTPQLQPYVFRNYEHPAGRDSHYRGSSGHKLWEAMQASAAAPGYFEEVKLGSVLHQDGGVLVNNPTALGLHEARLMWPTEHLQCVVSVGNGRTVTELEPTNLRTSTRIQDKISKIVDSATDTELVHVSMHDLLPANSYFRLNPYMSFPYTLDEIQTDRLDQMQRDAKLYVRRNRDKIQAAANQLIKKPTAMQVLQRKLYHYKHLQGFYHP